MLYSNYIKNSSKDGRSNIYRSPKCANGFISYLNVKTLYEVFIFGYRKNPNAKCLGEIKELNPIRYDWLTYTNVFDAVSILGSRLLEENYLIYQNDAGNINSSNFIGILLQNSSNYIITELACHLFSYISVPIYDTFSPNTIEMILNQTKIKILFVDNKNIKKLLELTHYYALKKIVSYHKIDNDIISKFRDIGIDIIAYSDFCGEIICKQFIAPKPGFVASICYTCGTMGEPKGVILTHENIIGTITGAVYNNIIFNDTDTYISYLPLTHIFEKIHISSILYGGGSIGFSRGDINLLLDDIKTLQPTIFPIIPVLYNRIYDMIMHSINSNVFSRNLFHLGYKLAKYDYRISNTLLEKTLFKSIREELGGRVRLMISGTALIESKILDFMKVCFCCNVIEQYGLTETTACISFTKQYDKTLGHIGGPITCGEICVNRVPHLEYISDVVNNVVKGELLYRGDNVFQGYYSGTDESCGNEYQIDYNLTNNVLDKDGWFHTGDFVEILNNGAIRLIGRISNIIKLDNGEFISFEKIQSTLETVPNVYQAFVYGENKKSNIIALLVLKDRTQIPNIETDLMAHMDTTCRTSGFKQFEIPNRILILNTPFTVENGCMTPTFKLKREQIIKKYNSILRIQF